MRRGRARLFQVIGSATPMAPAAKCRLGAVRSRVSTNCIRTTRSFWPEHPMPRRQNRHLHILVYRFRGTDGEQVARERRGHFVHVATAEPVQLDAIDASYKPSCNTKTHHSHVDGGCDSRVQTDGRWRVKRLARCGPRPMSSGAVAARRHRLQQLREPLDPCM